MKTYEVTVNCRILIKCTEPESFKDQTQFAKQDVKAMRKYLEDFLKESLVGKWQYAAKVERVKINRV